MKKAKLIKNAPSDLVDAARKVISFPQKRTCSEFWEIGTELLRNYKLQPRLPFGRYNSILEYTNCTLEYTRQCFGKDSLLLDCDDVPECFFISRTNLTEEIRNNLFSSENEIQWDKGLWTPSISSLEISAEQFYQFD